MARSLEDLKSPLFWRAVVAELLGTAFLVFVGIGSATSWDENTPVNIVQVAFAFGLTLTVLIFCFGGCSGCHVNPAVTVAMLITRKISVVRGILYVIGQCVGGTLGAGLLKGVTPEVVRGTLGVSSVNETLSAGQAFGVEFLLTFTLVFTVFAVVDEKREQSTLAPIAIGTSVVAAHLMGVYWCGPLLGGIAAGLVYENIFAANASLQKTRDYMLSANYQSDKYDGQKERFIKVDQEEEEFQEKEQSF